MALIFKASPRRSIFIAVVPPQGTMMRSLSVCPRLARSCVRCHVRTEHLHTLLRINLAHHSIRDYTTRPRRKASKHPVPPSINTVLLNTEVVPSSTIDNGPGPVRNEEEYKMWASSCDRGMRPAAKSKEEFESVTKRLTTLCQRQVNFWHGLAALTDNEIQAIKKVGKLAIFSRDKTSTQFISLLDKEKCFNPDVLYLAAQTLFRQLPASASAREIALPEDIDQTIFYSCSAIRFRLFYAGLLAGHVPSALWLWSVIRYDTPEGKAEEEMILRCLGDENLKSVKKEIATLAKAVKTDAAGDGDGASKFYKQLERLSLGEFEFLWKRQVEHYYAVDAERAFQIIMSGVPWVSPPLITTTLEQFLGDTRDPQMKLRLALQLHEYNPMKYSIHDIAKRYDALGETGIAAEWHELAGAQGNKDSQAWMVKYFEMMAKKQWFGGQKYRTRLRKWKEFTDRQAKEPREQANSN